MMITVLSPTTVSIYLTMLRGALAGPRGEVIRRMLAPGSERRESWPRDARFYVGDGYAFAITESDKLSGAFATEPGRGDALVTAAIDAGARRLDHFDCGPLSDLYARHGFAETWREPNWAPGGPDVVHRELQP